jgi:chromosomal replication initiator protein
LPAREFDARELARTWHLVLDRLKMELNPHTVSTWLKPTHAAACDGEVLRVEARSAMAVDWLDRRLRTVIERACAQAFGAELQIEFVVAGSAPAEPEVAPPVRTPSRPVRSSAVVGTVNCSFTFDGYHVSPNNRMAFNACRALLEADGTPASPVVLYGPPGMGKSHLLHALACRAAELDRHVALLSAEEFTNRYQRALRANRMDDFQDQLRSIDLFLIDDLQSLPGRPETQKELVYTIDEVNNRGGSVVVASERSPFELGLIERLESRLVGGLLVKVGPFDREERRAFIEHTARRRQASLPAWALQRLSACEAASVRVMVGAVNAAIALERDGQLDPRTLDASLAASAATIAPSRAAEPDVLARVAALFEVAVADLSGRGRGTRLTEARAVSAALLQESGYSLPRIARLLGDRDKSTISTLASRGRELLKERTALREQLAA